MVRERINLEKLRKLLPDEEEFVCLSDDHLTNRSGPVPAELNSYNEKGGLMRNLIIRRGAPVMMISNHTKSQYKEDGLCNGLTGFIDYIQVDEKDPTKVNIIWMVPKNKNVGKKCYFRETRHLRPQGVDIHPDAIPILPLRRPVDVLQGGQHFIRKQFALTQRSLFVLNLSPGRQIMCGNVYYQVNRADVLLQNIVLT